MIHGDALTDWGCSFFYNKLHFVQDTTLPPISSDFEDTLKALLCTPPPPKNLGRPKVKAAKRKAAKKR